MVREDIGSGSAGSGGRRRYWKRDEKRRIVAESLEAGASVAEVARRYGLNANLLFTWRRTHLDAIRQAAQEPPTATAVLLPVTLEAPKEEANAVPPPATPRPSSGTIEIEIGVARVRLRGCVDEASLRNVVSALREFA